MTPRGLPRTRLENGHPLTAPAQGGDTTLATYRSGLQEVGLQMMPRSPDSSWVETDLGSWFLDLCTQEEQAGKPHRLVALVISPPGRNYNIPNFPALSPCWGGKSFTLGEILTEQGS